MRILSVVVGMFICAAGTAQQWQVGAEAGVSFVLASDFDTRNNLRTSFFSPGVFVQRSFGKNWSVGARYTRTRFDYYDGPSTIEEYDAHTIHATMGRWLFNHRMEAEVGLGVLHGVYFLNDFVFTEFSAVPSLAYQVLSPQKPFKLSVFARYPLVFSPQNVWGFFSTGVRVGYGFSKKNNTR
jgi:hypothetical protein